MLACLALSRVVNRMGKEDEAYRGDRRGTIGMKTEERRGNESELLTSMRANKMALHLTALEEFKPTLQLYVFFVGQSKITIFFKVPFTIDK